MRGLTLRNNLGLRGRRHATFLSQVMADVIRGLASTAAFQYLANEPTNTVGPLVQLATIAILEYLGATDTENLFGGIDREGNGGSYSYQGIDGAGVVVSTNIGETGSYAYQPVTPSVSLGAISQSSTTPSKSFTGVDGVASNGALTQAATTGSFAFSGVDATGDIGGSDPWADWSHYFSMSANSAQVGSDETDIVAWFDLSNAPASFWTNLGQTDGDDIRVASSDGTTEYPTYVLFIDTTAETGLVAAKVASLTSGSDATYRMYIGNASYIPPATSAVLGRDSVFDWQFEAVFGLFAIGTTVDLTGNGHDAPVTNATVTTTNSRFGQALNFDSALDKRVTIPDAGSLNNLATFTVLWEQHKIGTAVSSEDVWGWSGANRARLQTGTYRDRIGGVQTTQSGTSGDHDDVDQAIAWTYDGVNDESAFFTEGVKQAVGTGQTGTTPGSGPIYLGGATSNANDYIGTLSLWMIATSELADDHIITTQNMWIDSSFWTWGTIVSN